MADFRLAAPAEAQIIEILKYSASEFGDIARERYAALLVQAMQDIAKMPDRPAVTWKETDLGRFGIYHVRHSRHHVAFPPGPVIEPRHFIVFQIGQDDIVDVLGFIHDSMLFNRALSRIVRQHEPDRES